MLSRRTIRGPATGFFHTAVCTVLPCQVTSFGIPTLTDSRAPARFPEVATCSPSHAAGQLNGTAPSCSPVLPSRSRLGAPLAPVTAPGFPAWPPGALPGPGQRPAYLRARPAVLSDDHEGQYLVTDSDAQDGN